MRIKEGFVLHRIGDDCMVMHDGSTHIDFNQVINLNPTAAMLWEQLEGRSFDARRVTTLLREQFPGEDELRLQQDVEAFIYNLEKAGLVEP